jgi:peroxiredoxin Q/BCP
MLKIGTAAPGFDAVLETGESFKFSNWAGTKNVVIFFFPKAFTKG